MCKDGMNRMANGLVSGRMCLFNQLHEFVFFFFYRSTRYYLEWPVSCRIFGYSASDSVGLQVIRLERMVMVSPHCPRGQVKIGVDVPRMRPVRSFKDSFAMLHNVLRENIF